MTDKIINITTWADGNILYAADLIDSIEGLNNFSTSNLLTYFIDNSATTTNQINFLNDDLSGSGSIDTTNSTGLYDANLDVYIFCTIFDAFEDGSIDATKWSTAITGAATVTETGGFLRLTAASGEECSAISNGASGFDGRSFSGNSEFIIDMNTSNADSGADWYLYISNGTTHITLASGNGTVARATYRVVINKSAQTCDVYTDDTISSNDVNISTATTNWYIRFRRNNATTTAKNLDIAYVGYDSVDSSGNIDFVTTAQTPANSANASIGIFKGIMSVGSIAAGDVYFSANNGTGYSSASNKEKWIRVPTVGTQVKLKLEIAKATTITATAKNIPTLTEYAIYFI